MALFLGGPADGWRIQVDTSRETVLIPINPHPPAFTPDNTVLAASASPAFLYKREEIQCSTEIYYVYVPEDWNCADILDALILGYKVEKDRERLRYVRTAEGQLYDNDDRVAAGRPYSLA
jgi:hypothetical protein